MSAGWSLAAGVASLLALVTLIARPAAAAIRTWDGGDTANQLWSDPNNWSADTVPVPGDDVVFGVNSPEDAVVDVDVAIASLTIDGYLGRISVSPGRAMVVTGDLSQTSGTFIAPAHVVVGGRFSNTGGRFDGTGGALFLTAAGSQAHRFTTVVLGSLNVSNGLLAYWRLDDTGNPTRDVSGGRTDLAFESTPAATSGVPAAFANPGALAFSGAEEGLATPAYPSLLKPDAWTVSLWFRPNATYFEAGAGSCGDSGAPGPGAELLSAGEDYALRTCRVTATGMNVVRLFFRTTAGLRDCVTGNGFTANGNAWHHVAASASGGATRTVYLDGVATACSFALDQAYQGGPLRIARHFTGSAYDFGGAIDDVRIYNRPLAASEVQTLRQGRHPGVPAGRHVITGPVQLAGDLVVASRTLELIQPPSVGGSVFNFGGAVIVNPAADAGADAANDAPDAPAPDAAADLLSTPDLPAPEDGSTSSDLALSDAGVPPAGDAGGQAEDAQPGTRRIDLRVGCACRAGDAGSGPGGLVLVLVGWWVRRRLR